MAALSLSVALSALTIGAILSTALLIGPAAAALRLGPQPRPGHCVGGRYRRGSYLGRHCPGLRQLHVAAHSARMAVSFFVVSLVLVVYLLAQLKGSRDRRRVRVPRLEAGPGSTASSSLAGTPAPGRSQPSC
ncbi:MAG TPA: hypothetical protein VMF65_22165 [Acidimicrobiales bacterium]|nr:hypothetical protein [Acidimicrobiales bacterium]